MKSEIYILSLLSKAISVPKCYDNCNLKTKKDLHFISICLLCAIIDFISDSLFMDFLKYFRKFNPEVVI